MCVVLCVTLLFLQTHNSAAVSVPNLKTVDKRLVNGSPMNTSNFKQNWYFTAMVEIWHNSHAGWVKHRVCLGTFLQVGESYMVATAADCFLPSGHDHTQFSYLSKNNYRVFLGVVRLRYGYWDLVGLDKIAIRSTAKDPLVIIHPEWQFGNSSERTNIAIVNITPKCIDKLNVALADIELGKVPHFRPLQESEGSASGYCKVSGWDIDWNPTIDVFDWHISKTNFVLQVGHFLSQDSSTCNQYFSFQSMRKQIDNSTFCITGVLGDCVELYLSDFEYGSGVICNEVWSGFVSVIHNTGVGREGLPILQFATVSSAAMFRRFVSGTRFTANADCTCFFKNTNPAQVGGDVASNYMINSAKDYTAP